MEGDEKEIVRNIIKNAIDDSILKFENINKELSALIS